MPDETLAAEAPALSVASWRRLTPERLRTVRHDLRAHLLSITTLPDRPALLTKGAADEPVASMAMASAVRDSIEDDDSDLVWSWIALAAVSYRYCSDSVGDMAHVAVAARLVTLSTETVTTDRRQGLRLRGLALRWADRVADQVGTSNVAEHLFSVSKSAYVSVQALIESVKPKSEEASPAAVEATRDMLVRRLEQEKAEARRRKRLDGKPTLAVVKEIALGRGGSEDKALVAAWASLTEPMPLAGGVNPSVLEAALEAEFPWLTEAIEAVVGDLQLRRMAGAAHAHFRPLVLTGPPGTGKTRFARRLASLLGTGFGEVTAAGSSDNRLLQGTARGWSTASPSYVLHVMRSAKAANPVVLVDELDKTKPDGRNGDIRATLLTMLEPLSAKAWPDECLMAQADLSQINWIVCVNEVEPIRGPLLTRLRVVPAPMPGPEHFEPVMASIARDLAEELGVPVALMPELPAEAKAKLREAFGKGFSLRRIKAAYEGAIRVSGEIGTARTVN